MSGQLDTCTLCSLPVPERRITDDAGSVFCCTGCRGVYDVLGEQERTTSGTPEPDTDAVSTPDSHETTFISIDGMHCTSCETYIALIASRKEGVSGVEASYVSDTVRITHDPAIISVDELLSLLSRLGYRAYHRDDAEARKRAEERTIIRVGVGLVLGAFVMFAYMMLIYPTYFGDRIYGDATELLVEGLYQGAASYLFITVGILTTGVLLYTGGPILRGAYISARTRSPNMDLLIAIAATSAYLYSWLEIYIGGTHIYFDVTVAIILIVPIGGEYESTIKQRALGRLSDLTKTRIDEATVIDADGELQTVPIDDVSPGSDLLVREGERVAVDGTVSEGNCAVDESVITGESLPVTKRPGDTVVGGCVVVEGAPIITVGEEARSSLDRVTHLLWNLQSETHGIQRLADKLATIFVPLVLIAAGAITTIYLLYLGTSIPTALLIGLTVLIVSCPCAMGLATPLAVAAGVRDALANGIVVFDDTVFERLREMDVVIFDKTGTLTTGDMTVISAEGPDELLRKAAVLERRSAHPIARAIDAAFSPNLPRTDGGVTPPDVNSATDSSLVEVDAFESYIDGVGGIVDGEDILVGHPNRFRAEGWRVPNTFGDSIAEARKDGHVPVLAGRNGEAEGVLVIGDEPRTDWEETIADLSDRGVTIVVLTGDEAEAAESFSTQAAVDHVFAGVPPEAKAEIVQRFGADQQTVMVGDGTNDALALASADLGIALGSGTAIAADAADVAIVDDRLSTIPIAFDLSIAAGIRVKQNIGWAFVYNGIAIPLAISGLLNPLLAAIAMGTSSVLVVANSSRKIR